MVRELRRTIEAFSGPVPISAPSRRPAEAPYSKLRAVVQIVLTVLLVPLSLWVLFVDRDAGEAARNAASALLGAVVTFWLKD
jgi:hypothetical protein